MKKLIIFLFSLVLSSWVWGQSTSNYTFSGTVTGQSLETISGSTTLIAAATSSTNDVASQVTDIGFDFVFLGKAYSQFSVNDNGILRLGSVAISPTTYAIPNSTQALIAPFGTNLTIGTTGQVFYKLKGSVGSQILVVQWFNMLLGNNVPNASTNKFELRLYEANGKIEFVYNGMTTNLTPPTACTIGFSNNTSTGNAINITSLSNTASTITPVTPNSYTPSLLIPNLGTSGCLYSFLPVAPGLTAPTGLSFSAVGNNKMDLNWTDAANELGYAVYRSEDGGTTYKLVANNDANDTYYSSGLVLIPGVNYTWKVESLNEGNRSSGLVGSQVTDPAGSIIATGSGNWSSTAIDAPWPNGIVPTISDDVTIPNGMNVTLDVVGLVCNNLTIGTGGSGSLVYSNIQQAELKINGSLNIASGANFNAGSSGFTSHQLRIGGSAIRSVSGSLTNNGVFDMNIGSTGVTVSFLGNQNGSISGSGTCDFYNLILNKGTNATGSILDVISPITFRTVSSNEKALDLQTGTFKLSSSSTFTPWGGTQIIVPSLAKLWINNASSHILSGFAGSPSIDGILQIDAGSLSYGSGDDLLSVGTNALIYLNGTSANLNIFGAVSFASSSLCVLKIVDGNFNVDAQETNNLPITTPIVTINAAMTVDWTGGKINIIDPHFAGNGTSILALTGGSKNLVGSTLSIGDGVSTTAGDINETAGFGISSTIPFHNLVINNKQNASNSRMCRLLTDITVTNNLRIETDAYLYLGNGLNISRTLTTLGNVVNKGTLAGCHPGGSQHVGTLKFTNTTPVSLGDGSNGNYTNFSTILAQANATATITVADNVLVDKVTLFNGSINPNGKLTIGSSISPTVQIGGNGINPGSFTSVPAYSDLARVKFLYENCGTTPVKAGLFNEFTNANPLHIATLSCNNANGMTVETTLQIDSPLKMTAGNINIKDNNITLGSGTSSSVEAGILSVTTALLITTTGTLTRWFPTTGLPTSANANIGNFPLALNIKGIVSSRQAQVSFANATSLTTGGTITVGISHIDGLTSIADIIDTDTKTINTRSNSFWSVSQNALAGSGIKLTLIGTNALFNSTPANTCVMLASSVVGTAFTGGGSSSAPIGNRISLVPADLNNIFYLGGNDNEVSSLVYSKLGANGEWSVNTNWEGDVVPLISQVAVIVNGSTIKLSDSQQIKALTVNAGGNLTMLAGGNLTVEGSAASGISILGTLTGASGSTITVGTLGNNRTLATLTGGTLDIANGRIDVNGNVAIAVSSTFKMALNSILNIDGNSGTGTSSVLTGVPLLSFLNVPTTTLVAGGIITIVDPHFVSAQKSFSFSNAANASFGTGNTLKLGDGISTGVGAGSFIVDVGSTKKITLGKLIVNGGITAGRSMTMTNTLGVLSDLTVNGNSTLNNATLANIYINGSLHNNGTFVAKGTLGFQNYTSMLTTTASTISESVDGTGTFTIADLKILNSNVAGVTLFTPISVSTLALDQGTLVTDVTNFPTVTGGLPASVTAIGMVKGPLAVRVVTNGSTFLFPTGKTASSPLELLTSNTNETVVIKAEVFDTNAGGSIGTGMSTLNTNKHWETSILSGSLSNAKIKLTDPSIGLADAIASSSSLGGSYAILGGDNPSQGGTSITTQNASGLDGFYVLGRKLMTYVGSAVTQAPSNSVLQNSPNQLVIGFTIETDGLQSPLNATSFDFTTTGTTDVSKISNAKIWKTGNSAVFATTALVGTIASPGTGFTITANENLTAGINYFWLTYDIAADAVLGSNVDAQFTTFTASSVPHATITPDATGVCEIKSPLSGTYTVGAGGSYTSLTGAGGLFANINALGLKGNVDVSISSDLSEDGSNVLNQWIETLGSGYTLKIVPDAAIVRTINCSQPISLITLNGADRVIFDGRFNATGNGRFLNFVNNDINFPAFLIDAGATNNTLKNVLVNSSNADVNSGAISFTSNGLNSNNIIDNSIISTISTRHANSIYLTGLNSTNNTITKNELTDFTNYGIFVQQGTSVQITSNTISQLTPSSKDSVGGIFLARTPSAFVSGNKIFKIGGSATSDVRGIFFYGSAGTINADFINNSILLTPSTSGVVTGIDYAGNSTNSFNIFYNTIVIDGVQTAGNFASQTINKREAATTVNIQNNILVNKRTNTGATAKHFAIALDNNTSELNIVNNNDYFTVEPNKFIAYYNGAEQTTFADWQTNTTKDAASFNVNPMFKTAEDLSLTNNNCVLNNSAAVIAITTDFSGATRSSTPDLGFLEFTSSNPVVLTQPANVTKTVFTDAIFTALPTVADDVLTYSWQVSTDGTNYTNLADDANSYAGVFTNTLTVKAVKSMDGYKFRCNFASDCFTTTTASAILTVVKGLITVKAIDKTRVYGAADPAFDFDYTGFLKSLETFATTTEISGNALATCLANGSTNVSTVEITSSLNDLVSENYDFQFVHGKLTITKQTQAITFAVNNMNIGDLPQTITGITGGASGNAVVFTSSDINIATVSGNVITALSNGVCNIIANQASNGNYTAAPQVSLPLTINANGIVWNGSTWSNGTGPTVADDAIINGLYDETQNIDCKNLTIGAGKQLVIISGRYANVTGTLVNNNGINGIVVKQGGSLLHSTPGVLGSVEMTVSGGGIINTTRRWHLIASPVAPIASQPLFAGINLYNFYEAGNSRIEIWPRYSGNLQSPEGYLLYSPSNTTKVFTGVLNEGDLIKNNVSFSNVSGTRKGYYLLANPYASTLDWNVIKLQNTNISNSIWIWNSDVYNYQTYDGSVGVGLASNLIPACHSFIVRANNASNQIKITNSARVTAYKAFEKGATIVPNLLKLKLADSKLSDELAMYFTNETSGSAKMFSMSTSVPQICIQDESEAFAIARFEGAVVNKDVKVNVYYNDNTELKISASDFTFGSDVNVSLEDLKLNKTIQLSKDAVYTFDHLTTNAPERFIVHFKSKPTAISEVEASSIKVYSFQKQIYISSLVTENGMAVISDFLGRIITLKSIQNGVNVINMDAFPSGIYVVQYTINKSVFTSKVHIE